MNVTNLSSEQSTHIISSLRVQLEFGLLNAY